MQGAEPPHFSVLAPEAVDAIAPRPGGRYIDGTVGAGGHAAQILESSGPDGTVLGLDGDPAAVQIARARLEKYGSRAVLVRANFNQLYNVAQSHGFLSVQGVILDLGLSSMQLSDPARGFSFAGETLDMRMDPSQPTTAGQLVNTLGEKELADLLFRYGEEHSSRRIARRIVDARPVESAAALAEIIARAVRRRGKTHPATKTFQALRIAVNRELENLKLVLPQLARVVAPGGRVAIITFHSLEDRIVKNFFKSNDAWINMTKHPIRPAAAELQINPRARSAKLRVAEHIG